jgi:ribosomal protein S12 methylthiotransferase
VRGVPEPRFHMVSLGCPKNWIDSELAVGRLLEEGYISVPSPGEADLILVNTCAFIQGAKEEAIETILELAAWKERGRCRHLVVMGCLPQRYGDELLQLMPEVDLFLGSGEIPRLVEHLRSVEAGDGRFCHLSRAPYLLEDQGPFTRLVTGPSAYLRIAEGCSNRCSYCAVPMIRGPLRSRSIEAVVREAELLAGMGVKEVILVAQDTTAFGVERAGTSQLPELIKALDQVEGLRWIRLMYVHPAGVDERLVDSLRGARRLCPYLDLPVQHIAPRILREMNRRVGPQEIRGCIDMLREAIPGIHLRTSIIVGFPGESEDEFRELMDFLSETRFEWLGAFLYSREEGTAASKFPAQVPKKVARRRLAQLLRLQKQITTEHLGRWVGRETTVLVEKQGRGCLLGRSSFQAPEIDGVVRIKKGKAPLGSFAGVHITAVRGYDLEGVLLSLS